MQTSEQWSSIIFGLGVETWTCHPVKPDEDHERLEQIMMMMLCTLEERGESIYHIVWEVRALGEVTSHAYV